MPDLTPAEAQTATDFADAISRRDFRAAATLITNITNAGDTELPALLLEGVIDAGIDAVRAMAGRRVTVTQTMGDVPAGATVIGFQGGRF